MPSWKLSEVKKALETKGFQEARSTNHTFYVLHVDGRPTSIRTKVSFTKKRDLSSKSPLFKNFKTQLGLSSAELEEFLDCPMSRASYAQLVQDRRLVRP